jgi:O-antigen/teichoic acid export membrane protein
MVGYLAGSVAAAIVAIGLMFQRFNFARPSKHHFQSLIDFAKYNFLNGFVQKFYDNVDIIVITALLGRSATGVYGIGFQFSMLLTVFYSAINRASNPEISKYHTQGDYERIKEVMSDAIVLGLLVGIPAFTGFVVLARPIIVTFYTQEFAASTIVAVGAVATRIPEGLRSSLGSILAGVDRPDIGFHGGVILMVTNLVLDVILIPVVGVVGAVVASFIAMSLQLSYMGYHLINILDLSANDFPIWDVLLEIMAASLMAAVIYAAQSVVNPSSFISVFGLVLGGVCIYFTTILLISADIRSRLVAIFRDLLPVTA